MLANPYVGPIPFERSDSERFYGRDGDLRRLAILFIAKRIVLLYAPSGAGKTSLLQASLIPALEMEDFEVLPVIRVNKLVDNGGAGMNPFIASTIQSLKDEADQDLSDNSLHDYWLRREETLGDRSAVLIFDQFEEIITVNAHDQRQKREFFAELGQLLAKVDNLWALFAIREDYLAELDPYRHLLPGKLDNSYRLELLNKQQALEAIQKPAEAAGVEFTSAAAEKLIDQLRQVRIRRRDNEIRTEKGPFIEPVQLQVVCQTLWNDLQPEKGGKIETASVDAEDHVDASLGKFYDKTVKRIAADNDVSERGIRVWFDRDLISERGLRGQVMNTGDLPVTPQVIADLITAHLIRAEERRGLQWYEVAHDRLVTPIQESNQQWRQVNVSPYYAVALRWIERDKPDDLLLEGEHLAKLEKWEEDDPDALTTAEKEFLKASRDESRGRDYGTLLNRYGWGAIFPQDTDPDIVEALSALIEHRRSAAGDRFQLFMGEKGYHPGDRAHDFLQRQEIEIGDRNWRKVPYYLLIVGSPAEIPFAFQYQLSINYAVGRLHFDNLADYCRYARSVVKSETDGPTSLAQVTFFGAVQAEIPQTRYAVQDLVKPLAGKIESTNNRWLVSKVLGYETNKASLKQLVGGSETPALLLTSGHSIVPSYSEEDDADDVEKFGALYTGDWPGPDSGLAPAAEVDYYLSAADIDDDARLLGLIAFFFASNSAGTSSLDGRSRADNAAQSFISRLPQRLLGHPNGGALAIIGHVDNVHSASFLGLKDKQRDEGPALFKNLFQGLQSGHTVGKALDGFRSRYAGYTAQWAELAMETAGGDPGDAILSMSVEKAMIDMRNFIVLGDPAVRLNVTTDAEKIASRPTISPYVGTKHWKFQHRPIQSVAWSPGGESIMVRCVDGVVLVWERDSGHYQLLAESEDDPISQVCWKPDSEQVAGINEAGHVILWDANSGEVRHKFPDSAGKMNEIAWSADGKNLAAGSHADQIVQIWDSENLQLVHEINDFEGNLLSLSWSPLKPHLLIISGGEAPFLFGMLAGERIRTLGSDLDRAGVATWSPDGEYIAISSHIRRRGYYIARIWHGVDWEIKSLLRGHKEKIKAIRWLPDSRRLFTMSADQTTRLWDAKTGEERYALDAKEFDLNKATWDPSGTGALTIEQDRTARVWYMEFGWIGYRLTGEDEAVSHVSINPQGSHVLLLIDRRTLRIMETVNIDYYFRAFNGIDAITGDYAIPVMTERDLGRQIARDAQAERTVEPLMSRAF